MYKKIEDFLHLLKMEKRWQKRARILAVIVVFITTYMLILPATTMENEAYCGFVEHSHGAECYSQDNQLICKHYEHCHEDYCFISELVTDGNVFSFRNDAVMTDGDIKYYAVSPFAITEPVATRVNFDSLDKSGATYYIVYTYYNGRYYAIDGNGKTVQVTVGADSSVTTASMDNSLFWSFTVQSGASYLIQNLGTSRYMHSYYNSSNDYGVTTGGAYNSTLTSSGSGSNAVFTVKSNSNYSRIATSSGSVVFQTTTDSSAAAEFYLAEVKIPQDVYHVWFDGTCGGLMSLYESDNTYLAVDGESPVINLPSTWKSPSKYDYALNGWYDIKNHRYHKPGATVVVDKNTVFYADWVASGYDVGQNNEHVVPSLDTNSFIRTDMFDYSAVFNFHAVTHTGSVSASSHSEVWSVVQNDKVPYNDALSLGFIFRDWDSGNKHISYAANRARLNDNQGTEITSEITDYVYNMSGKDIIDVLFNPETEVIGKNYVGTGNYLYQFMEEGESDYDGTHNGYYYYDATKNAASFNQSDERFYIYDYLERTSDSLKDSFDSSGTPTAEGAYSDFLPFNSPYVNNSNNKNITDYADRNGKTGNYQYDAKATNQGSAAGNAGTNYWFGMKSEIEFYLPNDTGDVDAYGNYGNISTHGEHMNFQFHGDDDLWVFIDGELVMDIGGLHGIMNGKIDFSIGKVTTDYAENNALAATPQEKDISLSEGNHTLTIYYMERGGSQSNCAIYFNISPRYAMEIMKQDALSGERLNRAEFSVFTDEACTVPAELWNSEADYQNGVPGTNVFTVQNGKAYFWGISPGKLYYIREAKAPEGYPETDDIIRVAMNNIGGSVCITDSLRGENEEHTDGFDVLSSNSDEALHLLSVILTNQVEKTEETGSTNIRVSKTWAQGSENIPEGVTVYLTSDGETTEKSAVLSDKNGWTYTWTGLPKTKDGITDIVYGVLETGVPGFTVTVGDGQPFNDDGEWLMTDVLRDGDRFILVDKSSGNALSASGSSFTWISKENAESNASAQWTAIADGMGFHMINGNGYRIILDGTSRFVPTQDGNRILYYYNSKLFAQSGNVYYYFGSDASASSNSGLDFVIYKQGEGNLSGTAFELTNTPIPEDRLTAVSVTKSWADGDTLHTNDSVTVRLYANGVYTGRVLTLNKNNGWTGSFDGLLYSSEDGTSVSYTVAEDEVAGYYPEYSEITQLPGGVMTVWTEATYLEAGKVYMFTSGNYALACSGNSLTGAVIDESSVYQQWQAVSYNGNIKLKNLGNNRYLYSNRNLSMDASYTSNNSTITLSGGAIKVGTSSTTSRYVQLSGTTVSANRTSGTAFSLKEQKEITKNPTYALTVSNIKASYVLPETGGFGVYPLYAAGVALIVLSLVLLYKKRKSR